MSRYLELDKQLNKDYRKVNRMTILCILLFITVLTYINVTENHMKMEVEYMKNATLNNTPILEIVTDDLRHATFDNTADLEHFLNGMYEPYKSTVVETSDTINIYIFDKNSKPYRTYAAEFSYAYNDSLKIESLEEN